MEHVDPLVAPRSSDLRRDARTLEDDEFAADRPGAGVDPPLRKHAAENRAVLRRGTLLLARQGVGLTEHLDPQDRKYRAHLGEESLRVGLLGLRECSLLRDLCAVLEGCPFRAHGDLDYARLQVAPVPFVEGVFARGDQDGPVHPDTFAVAMPPASPSTKRSSMCLHTIAVKPSFLGMTANGRGSTRTVCAGLRSPQEGQWPHFPSPHFRTTIIG